MNLEQSVAPAAWFRAATRRLAAFWLVKLLGITAGMTLFFAAYFWLLHHPAREAIVMPLTALDRWIGFHPAALPLYLSLWAYVSLAPGLIAARRELTAYALAALALSAVGLGFFQVWPTRVPAFAATWAPDSPFAFLKNIDASGNACPSLHVAFAVFTAFVIGRQLAQLRASRVVRWLNWLWCAGIVYSTLATRQHVAYDAVAGAALGAAFGTGYLLARHRADHPRG
ncbi:MAG: phosphatase PAP2 family protein [Lacunisphaera sp.]